MLRHPTPARARPGRPRRDVHDLVHLGAPRPRSAASASSSRRTTSAPARRHREERRWWTVASGRRRRRPGDFARDAGRGSRRSVAASTRPPAHAARRRRRRRLPVERRPRLVGDRRARPGAGPRLTPSASRFEDAEYDESAYQDRWPATGGSTHTVVVSPRDIAELLPRRRAATPSRRCAPRRADVPAVEAGPRRRHQGRPDRRGRRRDVRRLRPLPRGAVRRFWAREPDLDCGPLLLERLNPYIGGRRSRRRDPAASSARPDRERRPALQPPDGATTPALSAARPARSRAARARTRRPGRAARAAARRVRGLTHLGQDQYLEIPTFL